MTDPVCAKLKKYTYAKYRFDFAAWAAGSALRGKKNNDVYKILKETGFCELAKQGVEWLPDPESFDEEHRTWCKMVSKEAKGLEIKDWSDGHSAKLINVFIKTLAPLSLENLPHWEEKKWLAVHPPIDGMVLKGMKNEGIGNTPFEGHKTVWAWLKDETASSLSYGSWTKFEYKHYREVIKMIHDDLGGCPFWMNERFFNPDQ